MATVISVYSGGDCIGRCDANCHEAVNPHCDCICGGRLHGCGGSEMAVVQNTADLLGEEHVAAWAERHGRSRSSIEVRTQPLLPLDLPEAVR